MNINCFKRHCFEKGSQNALPNKVHIGNCGNSHIGNLLWFVSQCSVILSSEFLIVMIQVCLPNFQADVNMASSICAGFLGMQSVRVVWSGRLSLRLQRKTQKTPQFYPERAMHEAVRSKPTMQWRYQEVRCYPLYLDVPTKTSCAHTWDLLEVAGSTGVNVD